LTVQAGHSDLENAGVFEIMITPRPNASLTAIEQVVDSVIANVIATPPTPKELTRATSSNVIGTLLMFQVPTANIQPSREMLLGEGELFAKDPLAFLTMLRRYEKLTAADVQHAAQRYLGGGHVVVSLVPAGKLDLISKPDRPYTNATPRGGT
jgi:predicted Zn-dependent peptidase